MSVSVRGIKQTRSMSNQTCHFGSISGLPPRVGVPLQVLLQPDYGLHCRANKPGGNCCCLPISQTATASLMPGNRSAQKGLSTDNTR